MRVELVYMKYNISDNQALFWCFVLIILRMASLDTLFLCFVGHFRFFSLPMKSSVESNSLLLKFFYLCPMVWRDAKLKSLQTRPTCRILLFLQNNSGLKITDYLGIQHISTFSLSTLSLDFIVVSPNLYTIHVDWMWQYLNSSLLLFVGNIYHENRQL